MSNRRAFQNWAKTDASVVAILYPHVAMVSIVCMWCCFSMRQRVAAVAFSLVPVAGIALHRYFTGHFAWLPHDWWHI